MFGDDMIIDIGHELKAYRSRNKLSQKDLEKLSGVAYVTISRLENGKGKAQVRTLRKLIPFIGGVT